MVVRQEDGGWRRRVGNGGGGDDGRRPGCSLGGGEISSQVRRLALQAVQLYRWWPGAAVVEAEGPACVTLGGGKRGVAAGGDHKPQGHSIELQGGVRGPGTEASWNGGGCVQKCGHAEQRAGDLMYAGGGAPPFWLARGGHHLGFELV